MPQLDAAGSTSHARCGNQLDAIQVVTGSEQGLWLARPDPVPDLRSTNPRDGGEERYSLERFGNSTSRHHTRLSRSRETGPEMRGLNVNDADTSKV